MLKYLGLLLLFSSAVMSGFYAATIVEDRVRMVACQQSFWRQFANQLAALCAEPGRIVALLAGGQEFASNPFFYRLWKEFDTNDSFATALQAAIAATPAVRNGPLQDILQPLCSCIGLRDLESQLAMLQSVLLRLEQLLQSMQQSARQKAGLYRRLGLFGGLLLAVIFF